MDNEPLIGMYELLDAIGAALKSAEPAKREALAKTVDAYCEDFPNEFYWAIGAQAPSFLSHLLLTIRRGVSA